MNNLAECSWSHSECFAYDRGGCEALNDTTFPKRTECPFFKTRDKAPRKQTISHYSKKVLCEAAEWA